MRLYTFLQGEDESVKKLAIDCGVAGTTISRIQNGSRLPSLKLATRIHNATRGLVTFSDLSNEEVKTFNIGNRYETE